MYGYTYVDDPSGTFLKYMVGVPSGLRRPAGSVEFVKGVLIESRVYKLTPRNKVFIREN